MKRMLLPRATLEVAEMYASRDELAWDLQTGRERDNGLFRISPFLGRLLRPSHCRKVCCICNVTNAEDEIALSAISRDVPPSKSFAEQVQKVCLLGK
jgi:hypothetical protein